MPKSKRKLSKPRTTSPKPTSNPPKPSTSGVSKSAKNREKITLAQQQKKGPSKKGKNQDYVLKPFSQQKMPLEKSPLAKDFSRTSCYKESLASSSKDSSSLSSPNEWDITNEPRAGPSNLPSKETEIYYEETSAGPSNLRSKETEICYKETNAGSCILLREEERGAESSTSDYTRMYNFANKRRRKITVIVPPESSPSTNSARTPPQSLTPDKTTLMGDAKDAQDYCFRRSVSNSKFKRCLLYYSDDYLAPINPRTHGIDWARLFTGAPRTDWLLIAMLMALIFYSAWFSNLDAFIPVPKTFTIPRCNNESAVDKSLTPCLDLNETHLLTHENVNNFVKVIHSSILQENCFMKIQDKFVVATSFRDQYPLIENRIIFNDLIREHKYEPDTASKFIRIFRIFFNSFSYGLIRPEGEIGFLYIHDSLLKYCNYTWRQSDHLQTICYVILVFHIIIILIRLIGRRSIKVCSCSSCKRRRRPRYCLLFTV